HTPSGDVTAHMMTGPDIIPLWSGSGFQAAALPYVGNNTTMIVIVPDAGTFDAFEQSLTGDVLGTVFAGQSGATPGAVILPRFKFVTKTDLVATLETLGMKQAFQAAEADFSGIDGGRDLHVTDVVHQATIAVDDQGTGASGAPGAVFSRKSAVLSSLRVDRPFLFVIRNDATGA